MRKMLHQMSAQWKLHQLFASERVLYSALMRFYVSLARKGVQEERESEEESQEWPEVIDSSDARMILRAHDQTKSKSSVMLCTFMLFRRGCVRCDDEVIDFIFFFFSNRSICFEIKYPHLSVSRFGFFSTFHLWNYSQIIAVNVNAKERETIASFIVAQSWRGCGSNWVSLAHVNFHFTFNQFRFKVVEFLNKFESSEKHKTAITASRCSTDFWTASAVQRKWE